MCRVVCIDPSHQSHNASGKYPIMYQKGTLWDMGLVYCGIYARCQLQRQDVPYSMNTLRDLNKVTEILSCLLSTDFFIELKFVPGLFLVIQLKSVFVLVMAWWRYAANPFLNEPSSMTPYDRCVINAGIQKSWHIRGPSRSENVKDRLKYVSSLPINFPKIVAISHGNLQLIYQITNTQDRRQLDIDPRLSRRIDISWIDIDSRVFSILDHTWTWVCLYMAKTSGCWEKKTAISIRWSLLSQWAWNLSEIQPSIVKTNDEENIKSFLSVFLLAFPRHADTPLWGPAMHNYRYDKLYLGWQKLQTSAQMTLTWDKYHCPSINIG